MLANRLTIQVTFHDHSDSKAYDSLINVLHWPYFEE